LNKADFDTVRDLEAKARPLFKYAFFSGLGGALLWALGGAWVVFAILGIFLVVVAFVMGFVGMIWMIGAQKEPTRVIYCPYCASKNEVFTSRKEFSCDICHRRIGFGAAGEPIPLDSIDDDDD
jgi:hypothetical protein